MDTEYKNVSVAGLKSNDDEGIVEAIVSVTGIVDNVNDIIEPGAYEKTLATRKPKGVWHHAWDKAVAKTLDIKELMPGDPNLPSKLPNGQPWPKEAGALMVKMQFNIDGDRGKQAYSDVKFFDDEQEWSIGYNVPQGGSQVESKSGIRRIRHLDLYEYSPVLFGAMPNARTQATVKDIQMAFKSLGMNQFGTETKHDPGEDQALVDELDGILDPDDYELPEEDGEKSFNLFTGGNVDPDKIRVAIKALQDVLDDMGEDSDYLFGDAEEKTSEAPTVPTSFYLVKSMNYTDVVSAVIDYDFTGSVHAHAKAFDVAVASGDIDKAEESANEILDELDDINDADEEGEKAAGIIVVTGVLQRLIENGGEKKSIRSQRAEFLKTLPQEEFLALDRYMSTVTGNTAIKSAVDAEAGERSLTEGSSTQKKTMKPKKVKPGRRGAPVKKKRPADDMDPEETDEGMPEEEEDEEKSLVIDVSEFENAGIDIKSLLGS